MTDEIEAAGRWYGEALGIVGECLGHIGGPPESAAAFLQALAQRGWTIDKETATE